MQRYKAVNAHYVASEELDWLLDEFARMCNDAVRIAERENPRTRFKLIELAYPRLKCYGLHTHYSLSACEIAFALYKNKRRKSMPLVRKGFMKLGRQAYYLNHLVLRIPTKPRRFIYLALQLSNYHLSLIDDPSVKKGSVTLNGSVVSIAISKDFENHESSGAIGVDVNERNVTCSDSHGNLRIYDTSEIAEIRERYKEVRAKIGRRTRQDIRTSRVLYKKYGTRERNRTIQRLHRISKDIVIRAKKDGLCIVLEKLTGIRKLYRRGNGQGASFRGRMNSWAFRRLQLQIEYKARWEGVQVVRISAMGSSSRCPECGRPLEKYEGRMLSCPSCGRIRDRDVVASLNLMAAFVHAARPSK